MIAKAFAIVANKILLSCYIRLFGLSIPLRCVCQQPYYTDEPVWTSGLQGNTHAVSLGDVDCDGDLDLACGNLGQSAVLHLNEDGMLTTAPVWSSARADRVRSIALGDTDGDGDLDLVSGNTGQRDIQWDVHDRSEPPMSPGRSISLYFPHATWEHHPGYYAEDIRGSYEELDASRLGLSNAEQEIWGHLWRLDVAKSFSAESAGDEVTLAFSGVETIPKE